MPRPGTQRSSGSGSPGSPASRPRRSPGDYSRSPERGWRASPLRSSADQVVLYDYSPTAAERRREALFKAQLANQWEQDELAQVAYGRQRLRDDAAAAALRLDDTVARRQSAQRRAEDVAWAQAQVGRVFLIDSRSAGQPVHARVAYRHGKWWADYEVYGEPRQRQICAASSPGESLIKLRQILGDDSTVGASSPMSAAELLEEDDTIAFLHAHRLHGFVSSLSHLPWRVVYGSIVPEISDRPLVVYRPRSSLTGKASVTSSPRRITSCSSWLSRPACGCELDLN